MKTIPFAILLFCMTVCSPAQAEVYVPTAQVGEFLRQFGRAYRAGDREWFESAVDKDGIPGEAKGFISV